MPPAENPPTIASPKPTAKNCMTFLRKATIGFVCVVLLVVGTQCVVVVGLLGSGTAMLTAWVFAGHDMGAALAEYTLAALSTNAANANENRAVIIFEAELLCMLL